MGRVRSKDIKPELAIRWLVHSLGYHFRLHRSDLPNKPDLVFPAQSRGKLSSYMTAFGIDIKAALTHGCRVSIGILGSKARSEQTQGHEHKRQLTQLGWEYLIVWEYEVGKPGLTDRIVGYLG